MSPAVGSAASKADVDVIMCDPFVHAREAGAAVTIFAGLQDQLWGRTTLFFALDNVSAGVLMPWAGVGAAAEKTGTTRLPFISSECGDLDLS